MIELRQFGCALLGLLAASTPALAQGEDETTVGELEARLEALEKIYEDDIDDLQFEIELLHERIDTSNSGEVGTRAPNVFNPLITVVGSLLSRTDDRTVLNGNGDPIDDSFRLREVELDFRSVIDPWAEAVVIAAIESEVTGTYDLTIEEGYVMLKRLPFIDSDTSAVRLKVGRFRAEFGRINKVHTHNLPWATRPLAVQMLLGHDGYLSEGISGAVELPAPTKNDSVVLTMQVLSGGGIAIDPDAVASDYAPLGHLAWFRELGDEHTLELGVSARGGDSNRSLYGCDLTYQWKPLVGGQYRSFLFGGEFIMNDSDSPDLDRARGGYVWAQHQVSRTCYLGARYDTVEELANRGMDTRRAGVWFSCYTSEFFRVRVGVEHTESDVAAIDGLDTGFMEMSFVFGSHPSDPYWVNR